MLEIRDRIVALLSADALLLAITPGGVYDRRLKRDAPGATPNAWAIDPNDPARIPRLQRSVVVFDGGEVDAVGGPSDPMHPLQLRQTFPRIFLYVDATAAGKAAADAIDGRIRYLLNGWQTTLSTGYALTLVALNRSELLDSDEFPGALVCFRRFQGEYLRPREA